MEKVTVEIEINRKEFRASDPLRQCPTNTQQLFEYLDKLIHYAMTHPAYWQIRIK